MPIKSITIVITNTSPVMTLMAVLMGALAWVMVVFTRLSRSQVALGNEDGCQA
jgi:hypothetical protein